MAKNIVIVIPKLFHGGGAEKVAMQQAEMFRDMGHDVSFFTFHSGDNIEGEYSCKLSENKIAKAVAMIVLPWKLAKHCKQNKIDTVVSHTERANFVSLMTHKLLNSSVRVITVTHNYKYLADIKHRLLIKWLYPSAYKNITVSQAIEKRLQSLYKLRNTQTVYNPFDFEKITQLAQQCVEKEDEYLFENDKTTFINIGRLHHVKGQSFLIDTFAQYHKHNTNSQLLILGEGVLRSQLESQVDDLNMLQHVHLLGNKENVFPYLKKSDCFVLTSTTEGFGNVLVEAMAVGLPIISTDCPVGPREILVSGKETYGKLFAFGNGASLINHMGNVKQESDCQFLKKRAKYFSTNKNIKKWKELINR